MLPIYICEDDASLRSAQRSFLEREILIRELDMAVVLCSGHPEEILQAVEATQGRGIYFLDVELKGEAMDGFALGQAIRRLDSRGFIIYVTAFADLAFETFRYHLEALDYICKQDRTKMFADISRCLKAVTERMQQEKGQKQPYFTVKVLDVVRHIPVEEILYISTAGRTHRVELHTKRERLDFIGSMQELERTLGPGFCRVHRACLVNTDQITGVDRKQVSIQAVR